MRTLKHDGAQSGTAQNERRKHPCGTEARYDGSGFGAEAWNVKVRLREGAQVLAAEFLQQPLFVVRFKRQRIAVMYVVFLACVQRFFVYAKAFYLALSQMQELCGFICKELLAFVGVQLYVSKKYHFPSLPAMRPLVHAHCRL